jgi:hypothetical protein
VRSQVVFSVLLVVSLALAASSLAFVGGRAAADPAGEYERGVAAGERDGRAQARAALRRGEGDFAAIHARGHASGVRAGRRSGRAEGLRAGRELERREAFGSFPGGWQAGRWYVVGIERGDDGTRHRVGARVVVQDGHWYRLCGQRICQRLREATAGGPKSARTTASP